MGRIGYVTASGFWGGAGEEAAFYRREIKHYVTGTNRITACWRAGMKLARLVCHKKPMARACNDSDAEFGGPVERYARVGEGSSSSMLASVRGIIKTVEAGKNSA